MPIFGSFYFILFVACVKNLNGVGQE